MDLKVVSPMKLVVGRCGCMLLDKCGEPCWSPPGILAKQNRQSQEPTHPCLQELNQQMKSTTVMPWVGVIGSWREPVDKVLSCAGLTMF